MDGKRKNALQQTKGALIKDLEVKYIVQPLHDQGILTEKDLLNIEKFETLELQAAHLVETLIYLKNNEAYDGFVKILEIGYPWLAEILPNYRLKEEEDFHNALLIGDVPKEPPHYVERVQLLSALRRQLKSLDSSGQLVLCGRTGSGKSTLASAAISDKDFLRENFNNKVFWVDLKNVHNSDDSTHCLHELLIRIAQFFGENIDNIDNDKLTLRKLLLEHHLQSSLLILDNVSFVKAVDCFNIGFKMLITTQNRTIRGTDHLELSGGFTKEESLSLFKKTLNGVDKPDNFERYAGEIHNLCRGEPIVISLIASLIESRMEDFSLNYESWEDCIYLLKKQKYNLNLPFGEDEEFFGPIKMCFEILKTTRPDLYERYKLFAVVVEEVNITYQVLQTIWKLNENEVKSVMDELAKRSLVLIYYNAPLKTYVYCVHHLLLAFLKKEHAVELRKMHMDVVRAYWSKMENNAWRLPVDNYIYQYIGYHLKNAMAYDLLQQLYFNLEFLDGMIKAKGASDVLRDISLYRDLLIVEKSDEIIIEELQRFIKIHGKHLHDYSCCDIVKCGLGLPQESQIFKKCLEVASGNPRKLYFTLQAPEKNLISCSVNLDKKISAASFISFTDMILIATEDGMISLWEQNRKQKLCSFIGHNAPITSIQLNTHENQFLSVSQDGCVKIWNLENFLYDSQGLSNPRLKQKNYHEFYHCKEITDCVTCKPDDPSEHLVSACFAYQSGSMVTGSSRGRIVVWTNRNGSLIKEKEIFDKHSEYYVKHVAFSLDDSHLIACYTLSTSQSRLLLYSLENAYVDGDFDLNEEVVSLFILPGIPTKFITVGTDNAKLWKPNFDLKHEFRLPNGEDVKCSTITPDKKYFVASSSKCNLYLWEIISGHMVQKFSNIKGIPFCLEAFVTVNAKVHVLLLEIQDNHTLNPTHIESQTLNTTRTDQIIFAEHWEKDKFLVAIANFDNKLQIVMESVILAESEELPHAVTSMCFDVQDSSVYFGFENGRVGFFDVKTRFLKIGEQMFHQGPVTFIKCLKTNGNRRSSSSFVAATHSSAVYNREDTSLPIKGHNDSSKFVHIPEADALLCISKKGAIDMIGANAIDQFFGSMAGDGEVSSVAISSSNSLLAVTLTCGLFLIFEIEHGFHFKLRKISSKTLENAICCCCFSFDGRILAMGMSSGNIVIWSVKSEVVLKTLQLHKENVGYLLFSSQPELILLSVAEQLTFWNLSKIVQVNEDQGSYNLPEIVGRPVSLWQNKGEISAHLLGEFRLCGGTSNYVSASSDFSKFFTIDNNGNTYFMVVLNNV